MTAQYLVPRIVLTTSTSTAINITNFTHSPRTRRRSPKEQGRRKKNFYILGGAVVGLWWSLLSIKQIVSILHAAQERQTRTRMSVHQCVSVSVIVCVWCIYNWCEWCTTNTGLFPCLILQWSCWWEKEQGGRATRSTMPQRRGSFLPCIMIIVLLLLLLLVAVVGCCYPQKVMILDCVNNPPHEHHLS